MTLYSLLILCAVASSPCTSSELADYVGGDERFLLPASSKTRIDCGACGEECVGKCGTKLFRTCCFHFAKKKRSQLEAELVDSDEFKLYKREVSSAEARLLEATDIRYGGAEPEKQFFM